MPSNSKFLSSNVKFWPFSISNRFLCIHRNSYPIFFSVRYRKSNELKSRALLDRRWHLMYLHISLIQCCRYLCGNRCICKTLIFSVTDALFLTNVSATCFSSNLQILLSLPVMYNCIYILPFLGFKDTSFANLASTSHVFDNVRMLPSKIPHPQPVLSIPCRYSPVKMCILNLLFQCFEDAPIKILHLQSPKIHYRKYLSHNILCVLITSQLEPIHYLQKN